MQTSLMSSLVILAGLGLAPVALAQTSPIYLKPGQCILVGTQQVCSLKEDQGDTAKNSKPEKISICKWGATDESQPGLKGYGLYELRIKDDGSKTETLIKNFGPADKDGCEREAKSRS